MDWDPQQYLKFGAERGRAFHDLLARIGAENPFVVIDLGCGPGNLTRTLVERWPRARVVGVDASAEMVEKARSDGESSRLRFELADLRTWRADEPVDVLLSNATLQWVPGHLQLLPALISTVRPGGWFGFQVPGNFGQPTHTTIAQLCELPYWRERLAGADVSRPQSEEPGAYIETLCALADDVDVWESTYYQVLAGPDVLVEWMSGTGLRPVLAALAAEDRTRFLDEYRTRMRAAYPQRAYGTVLPYRRIFAVARAR